MKLIETITLIIITSFIVNGNDLERIINKGDSVYNKSFFREALITYEQAYRIDSTDYFILMKLTKTCNDLGEYYYELRDEDSSATVVYLGVKYADRFAKMYPDSAKVYSYLAWSFGNQALFEGGTERIKLAHKIKDNALKSMRMDSTDYLPLVILGIYNRQIAALNWFERLFANTFFGDVPEGSFEESEMMMLKALKLEPRIVIAAFHLSLTYKEIGDEVNEIKWLNKVLELPERNFRDKFAKRKAKERLSELLD